jgi:hypothetical protein
VESILHHTALAILNLDNDHANNAEHFLPETVLISKRIEMQLATEDESFLMRLLRKTNAQLMQHLCFGINVESEWSRVPGSVRDAILSRVTGNPVAVTPALTHWLISNSKDIKTEDFHVKQCLEVFQICKQKIKVIQMGSQSSSSWTLPPAELKCEALPTTRSRPLLWHFMSTIIYSIISVAKWIMILSGAASEVERELWYSMRGFYGSNIVVILLLLFWKICWYIKNILISTFLIYRRPALSNLLRLALRGATRELTEGHIKVELPQQTITGFASENEFGNITLNIFDGSLTEVPTGKNPTAIAVYQNFRLQNRQDEVSGGTRYSTYHYNNDVNGRLPTCKDMVEPARVMRCQYDEFGRITSGLLTIETTDFKFDYRYRKFPKRNSDIMRADYRRSQSSDATLSVFWCVFQEQDSDNLNTAIPSPRLTRIVRTIGNKRYVTTIIYQHKRDPRSSTVLEHQGRTISIDSPPKIFDHEEQLLEKPSDLSFERDDLLIHHRLGHLKRMLRGVLSTQSSVSKRLSKIASFLPFKMSYWSQNVVYQRVPTSRLRVELWKLWLDSATLDAVTACWLDEIILREEPLLRKYWRRRDTGQLLLAKTALDESIDEIVSSIEIPFDISQTCSLPIKPADLYTMGLGNDANQITNRPDDCFNDNKDRISIICNDIGCWPNAPGGVSNCRRDLVNGHKTIRNHVVAETANDFGIPRFQIETSIQSLKMLPLWGLDFKTAQHGIIDNLLQSQVDEKIATTDSQNIVNVFIPIMECFIKGARTKRPSRADLIACSNALLNMSTYFEQNDYNKTWSSKEVEAAFIQAWLHSYDDPNIIDPSELFGIEQASMNDFRDALNLYISNFLIYSIEVPEPCPRVFQSTHHGISSLFGMILKYRKGVTFGLWDHAILWRECCLNISPAQCLLPLSVQSMLLAGIGLAARLAYLHVDVVLPCSSVFNP